MPSPNALTRRGIPSQPAPLPPLSPTQPPILQPPASSSSSQPTRNNENINDGNASHRSNHRPDIRRNNHHPDSAVPNQGCGGGSVVPLPTALQPPDSTLPELLLASPDGARPRLPCMHVSFAERLLRAVADSRLFPLTSSRTQPQRKNDNFPELAHPFDVMPSGTPGDNYHNDNNHHGGAALSHHGGLEGASGSTSSGLAVDGDGSTTAAYSSSSTGGTGGNSSSITGLSLSSLYHLVRPCAAVESSSALPPPSPPRQQPSARPHRPDIVAPTPQPNHRQSSNGIVTSIACSPMGLPTRTANTALPLVVVSAHRCPRLHHADNHPHDSGPHHQHEHLAASRCVIRSGDTPEPSTAASKDDDAEDLETSDAKAVQSDRGDDGDVKANEVPEKHPRRDCPRQQQQEINTAVNNAHHTCTSGRSPGAHVSFAALASNVASIPGEEGGSVHATQSKTAREACTPHSSVRNIVLPCSRNADPTVCKDVANHDEGESAGQSTVEDATSEAVERVASARKSLLRMHIQQQTGGDYDVLLSRLVEFLDSGLQNDSAPAGPTNPPRSTSSSQCHSNSRPTSMEGEPADKSKTKKTTRGNGSLSAARESQPSSTASSSRKSSEKRGHRQRRRKSKSVSHEKAEFHRNEEGGAPEDDNEHRHDLSSMSCDTPKPILGDELYYFSGNSGVTTPRVVSPSAHPKQLPLGRGHHAHGPAHTPLHPPAVHVAAVPAGVSATTTSTTNHSGTTADDNLVIFMTKTGTSHTRRVAGGDTMPVSGAEGVPPSEPRSTPNSNMTDAVPVASKTMDAFASPRNDGRQLPSFPARQSTRVRSPPTVKSGDSKGPVLSLLPPGYDAAEPLFEIDECNASESLCSRTVDSQPGDPPSVGPSNMTSQKVTAGGASVPVLRAGRGGAVAVLSNAPSTSVSLGQGAFGAAPPSLRDSDQSAQSATGTGTTHNTSSTSATASAIDLLSTDDILRVYRFSLGGSADASARDISQTVGERGGSAASIRGHSTRGTMSSVTSVQSGAGNRGAGGSSSLGTFGHSTISHGTSTGTGGTTNGGTSASRSFDTSPPQPPLQNSGTGTLADPSRHRVQFTHSANPRESSCQSLMFVKRSSLIHRFGTSIFAALSTHENSPHHAGGTVSSHLARGAVASPPPEERGVPSDTRDSSTDCRSRVSSQGIQQGFRAFPSFSHATGPHLSSHQGGSTISDVEAQAYNASPHTQRSPSAALQYLTPLVDGTQHHPDAQPFVPASAHGGPLSRTSVSAIDHGVDLHPIASSFEDMTALAKAYFTAQLQSQTSFSAGGEESGSGDHSARPPLIPLFEGEVNDSRGRGVIAMVSVSAGSSQTASPQHGTVPLTVSHACGTHSQHSHGPMHGALRSMSYFGGGFSVHDGDVSISAYGPTKLTATSKYVEEDDGFYVLNNYILLQEAGRGQYGVVMIASDTTTEKTKAIKIIPKEKLKGKFRKVPVVSRSSIDSPSVSRSVSRTSGTPPSTPPPASFEEPSAFEREIAVMKKLRHRNIVRLEEVIDDPNDEHLYLVMPYIERGPVVRLENGKCAAIDVHVVRAYMKQLLSAVAYLHRNQVVHCDIKPDNVLLGADGRIYLADFGVSEMFTSDRSAGGLMMRATKGTPAFMAPETLSGALFDASQADIWAIGVSFYVFLFGQLPFDGASIFELYRTIGKEPLDLCRAFRSRWDAVIAAMGNVERKRRSSIISFENVGGGQQRGSDDAGSGALIDFANVDLLDAVSSPFTLKKSSTSTSTAAGGGAGNNSSGHSDGRRRSNNSSYFMVSMYEQTLGPGRRLSDVVEEDRARHRKSNTQPSSVSTMAATSSTSSPAEAQANSPGAHVQSTLHPKPTLATNQGTSPQSPLDPRGSSACPAVVVVPVMNAKDSDAFGLVSASGARVGTPAAPESSPPFSMIGPAMEIPALCIDDEGGGGQATAPSAARAPLHHPPPRRRSSDTRSVITDHVDMYEAIYSSAPCIATVRNYELSSLMMELAALEATYALTRAEAPATAAAPERREMREDGRRRSSATGLTAPATARPPTAVFSDDTSNDSCNDRQQKSEEDGRKQSSCESDLQSEHSTQYRSQTPPAQSGETVRPLPSEAFFFVRGEQLGRQIRALMLADAQGYDDDDDDGGSEEDDGGAPVGGSDSGTDAEEEDAHDASGLDDETMKKGGHQQRRLHKQHQRMRRLEEHFLDGISMRIGALDLLRLLLHRDPTRRATAAESLRHPFIKYGSAVRQRYNSLSSANSSGGGAKKEKVMTAVAQDDAHRSPKSHGGFDVSGTHTSALTAAASTSACGFSSSRFRFFLPRQPRASPNAQPPPSALAAVSSTGGGVSQLDPEALCSPAGGPGSPPIALSTPNPEGCQRTRKHHAGGTVFNTQSRAKGHLPSTAGPVPSITPTERDASPPSGGPSPVHSPTHTVAGAASHANSPTTIFGHDGDRPPTLDGCVLPLVTLLPASPGSTSLSGSTGTFTGTGRKTTGSPSEAKSGENRMRTNRQGGPQAQQGQPLVAHDDHHLGGSVGGTSSVGGRRGMVSFIETNNTTQSNSALRAPMRPPHAVSPENSAASVNNATPEEVLLTMGFGEHSTGPHQPHQPLRRNSRSTSIRASITAADVSQSTTRRNRAQESNTATTAIVQQWSSSKAPPHQPYSQQQHPHV